MFFLSVFCLEKWCVYIKNLPLLPQLGGKLAGEPAALLLLKSKSATFYKVDKQPFMCNLAIHDVEPKMLLRWFSVVIVCSGRLC